MFLNRLQQPRTVHSICFALTFGLALTTSSSHAISLVNISGGQVFDMDDAFDPSANRGTIDFHADSLTGIGLGTTGFLNAAVDLNRDSVIDPINEWVVQNVPMFIDDGLTNQPSLSSWFDPSSFGIQSGLSYQSYVTIDSNEQLDAAAFATWHANVQPAALSIWGDMDPGGQSGTDPAPSVAATLAGKYATPKYKDVPDIAQKFNECGPTSTANSLRWLAKKFNFNDKLPADDDTLIQDLMQAMAGNKNRPFAGLNGDQLFDGKKAYIQAKGLPLVVHGGNTDPNATGGKVARLHQF